jgi:tetratricopeptide (TPR) repeat protein
MRFLALGCLVAILLAAPAVAAEPSLGRARLLYTNKMYDEAKRELVAVAFSAAPDEEKAQALNLLGDIAIDQSNYQAAIDNWVQVTTTYPRTAAASEATAKLPLARKLADAPAASPATAPTGAGQAALVPDNPLAPGTVLVAGSAPEAPEYADQAVLEFMNVLASGGVRAQDAFAGRVATPGMSRIEAFSLPNLLSYAKKTGAASILYVFLHFQGMEDMRVECYAPDGRKLWSERVVASLGLGPSGMTAGFIRRMTPKILRHVGQPGLPITLGGDP